MAKIHIFKKLEAPADIMCDCTRVHIWLSKHKYRVRDLII
jgi:hypothetical protein